MAHKKQPPPRKKQRGGGEIGGNDKLELIPPKPLRSPRQLARMPLDAIKIGIRHRKDLGDVESLAQSIADIGLLHPVVVQPSGKLIAGARRIAACKQLGWREVPVNIVALAEITKGELAENTDRKNFLPSEIEAIRRAMLPKQKAAATSRKLSGRSAPNGGDTRDKIGAFAGVSGKTVERIAAVVAAAEEDPEKYGKLAADMDRTGRVNGPYKRLKVARQSERIRAEPPPLPSRGPYRVIVADPPWRYEIASEESNDTRRVALPHHDRRRNCCHRRGVHRASRLHPLALDYQFPHAGRLRSAQGMGLPTSDDSHLGEGPHGGWRLAARPDRARGHGNSRQANRAVG